MTVGILGSGFGLYGYLPALIELGEKVVMPSRYLIKLEDRQDVSHLSNLVEWVDTDEDVLNNATAVVLALRPEDQVKWVYEGLKSQTVERFLLEKPIAPNPAVAKVLIEAIQHSEKGAHIGFNFRHTDWAKDLRTWLVTADENTTFTVTWKFKARHYSDLIDTWKRKPAEGGGALRFYAIHVIALLAELGYGDPKWSQTSGPDANDVSRWQAMVAGAGLPNCIVKVDSDAAENIFSLNGSSLGSARDFKVTLNDPFEEAANYSKFDRRIGVVKKVCSEFLNSPPGIPAWCLKSITLWASIEARTAINGGTKKSTQYAELRSQGND